MHLSGRPSAYLPRTPARAVLLASLLVGIQTGWASTADHETADSTGDSASVTITHDELLALPFRSIEEVIGLQNGTVVLRSGPESGVSLAIPPISVRGGQPVETGYYLNGVPVNDPFTGYMTFRISPHAVERLSFESTAYRPDHGLAQSSAVAITTRSGGPRWSGMVETVTDNALGSGFDQNWYTTSLGGPIPGLKNACLFGLVERRYFGDRNPSIMTEDFLPDRPIRLPGNWLAGWSYNGRFDYAPRWNMHFTATVDGSETEWSEYIQPYYFNWPHTPYNKDQNLAVAGTFSHRLTPTFDYSVGVSHLASEVFQGDGVHKEDMSSYVRPYSNPDVDWSRLFVSWDDIDGVTTDLDEARYFDDYLRYKSSVLSLSGQVRRKWGDQVVTSAGIEYSRWSIRYYHNLVPTNTVGLTTRSIEHYGYDLAGSENDTGGTAWGNEIKHPKEYAVWLVGDIQLADLRVQPGLVLSVFDYDALILRDYHHPFDPDLVGDNRLQLADLTAAGSHTRLSPRLQLSYAVGRTGLSFRAGYAHFHMAVPKEFIYNDWHFFWAKLGFGSYHPHRNADMEPLKTRVYEGGAAFECSFADLAVTVFDRELSNAVDMFHVTPSVPFVYDILSGRGGVRTWGIEASFRLIFTDGLYLDLKRSWMSSEASGPWAFSAFNISWKEPSGVLPVRYSPSDLNHPHSSSAVLSYTTKDKQGPAIGGFYPLERTRLTLSRETSSGFPYTPVRPYDAVGLYSVQETPTGPINSASSPWTAVTHLMFERDFMVSGFTITPFLWVKNLFGEINVHHVYAGTGLPDNTGYLSTAEGIARATSTSQPVDSSGLDFEGKYQLAQRNPLNFGSPKQIMFGLRISF